ncbi:MAG: hypothetical protein ACE5M4_06330 [Anaerolineales bacterium]
MRNPAELDRLLASAGEELARLTAKRQALLDRIRQLQRERERWGRGLSRFQGSSTHSAVTNHSSQDEKIALFRSLFRGREDVYALKFEHPRTGRVGYYPARWAQRQKAQSEEPEAGRVGREQGAFLPLTDEIIRSHLLGRDPQGKSNREFAIGIYPLLPDETCWFLAVDFDKETWMDDVAAYLERCWAHDVSAATERSRSEDGGHVWIFFSEPIPSKLSRQLGTTILTETMERRPGIGLDSYDRLFPNQDTMPKGGLGNLIALPLQKRPRKQGNTVFLDGNFIPYPDQREFLSSIRRMSPKEVEAAVNEAERRAGILGDTMIVTEEADTEPWTAAPSRRRQEPAITGLLPERVTLVLSNQIYVEKAELPPPLQYRLIHLAAFQNPEFYIAQAMRLSTFGKPRIISCYEEFPNHLGLPRGCLDETVKLLQSLDIKLEIIDERFSGTPIEVRFEGILRPGQQEAAEAMLRMISGCSRLRRLLERRLLPPT